VVSVPVTSLKLPSGRVVELHEPTWGEQLHVTSEGLDKGSEAFTYAKYAVIVPGMTAEEIASLSRADGRALTKEVKRIFDGRPVDQEVPFSRVAALKPRVG
jgi:hypothetical protein